MKKVLFGLIIFTLPFIFSSVANAATTASFSPTTINTKINQTFSLSIQVNPNGTANYAEKIEVVYPADLVEVTSFTFSPKWIALTQSGYDSVDNTKGIMVKSAGYPSGITGATSFGIVTFKVKKSGIGNIKIGNNSVAFESNKETAITGNTVSLNSIEPVLTPIPVQSTKPVVKEPAVQKFTVSTSTEEIVATSTATTTIEIVETPTQVAAVSESVKGINISILYSIVGIIFGLLLGYGIGVVKR